MFHTKKIISFIAFSSLLPLASIQAGGPDLPEARPMFRTSFALGPRYIDDQVISSEAWDTVLRLSFGVVGYCKTYACRYGLDIGANTAWDSNFNSVNDPDSVSVSPLLVHNSASMDFLLFVGWNWRSVGFELGFGPQIAWVKWLNSVQQATSGVRVVPKLRLASTYTVAPKTDVFIAASQAFNPYGQLACSSGAFNCFDDSGYVSVTDLTLGVTRYF